MQIEGAVFPVRIYTRNYLIDKKFWPDGRNPCRAPEIGRWGSVVNPCHLSSSQASFRASLERLHSTAVQSTLCSMYALL